MPVTHGHGNPDWSREETILALDLYLRLNQTTPGPEHADIVALSKFLREMPVNSVPAAERQSFRNPAGVSLKIKNLNSIATGRGLKQSKTDRAVWSEFENTRHQVAEYAKRIRQASGLLTDGMGLNLDENEDEELPEGRSTTMLHIRRERSRSLRRKVLANRRRLGRLKCEICEIGPISGDAAVEDAIYEVHHNVSPIAAGERKTKLSDVALLCANCHKHLHRTIRVSGRWITVIEVSANRAPATALEHLAV